MAEARRLETVEQIITRLERSLSDLRSTSLARVTRRPTGDIEPSLRGGAKPGTLLLDGRTVFRSEYPGLWTWVVTNHLDNGPYGPGDGSSTFTLPTVRSPTDGGLSDVIWMVWT